MRLLRSLLSVCAVARAKFLHTDHIQDRKVSCFHLPRNWRFEMERQIRNIPVSILSKTAKCLGTSKEQNIQKSFFGIFHRFRHDADKPHLRLQCFVRAINCVFQQHGHSHRTNSTRNRSDERRYLLRFLIINIPGQSASTLFGFICWKQLAVTTMCGVFKEHSFSATGF